MKNRYIKLFAVVLLVFANLGASARTIHVSKSGSDANPGSKELPYKTISQAAFYAIAGDSVIIHSGTYRERVSPANGGISQVHRITYVAAPGERVYLKGSEQISGWKKVSGNVWRADVPNTIFGDFNPFNINIFGDWLTNGADLHLGAVYLDGRALGETPKIEDYKELKPNMWHAEFTDETTIIYANFDGAQPNKSLTEINVRPTCFFPKTTGVNYITVDGIDISQAATQWSAPTSEQVGIIGPNWSKGWIIKNCKISHSKCVGVCLGKERASGHNLWTLYKNEFGYTKCGFSREIEAILKAYDLGWNKANIGSHLIEDNFITECGQAGIVGHLGAIFSTIRHNEITYCSYKNDFWGFETGAIKLHAAIDVVIENNLFTDSRRGIWLDWQAQGTHVRNNVFSNNKDHDLFVEVSHGPTFVYNNIFLSKVSLMFCAQAIAVFNNLITGCQTCFTSPERYTPYHAAHSTKVVGLFNNTGGDLKFYNNVFTANNVGTEKLKPGLSIFDKFPASIDNSKFKEPQEVWYSLKALFPISTDANLFFKGTTPYKAEKGHTV
ncbi:MAG: right-handed parallel beta-helix repeat-containing protein, partial [Rikenellaceae bacterium]